MRSLTRANQRRTRNRILILSLRGGSQLPKAGIYYTEWAKRNPESERVTEINFCRV